jgi:RimJ/RimL family protein N-acetyltransferase
MVSLSTDRLLLREYAAGDEAAVHAYGSAPRFVEFMTWGPNTEEQTRAFIARQMEARQREPRTAFGLAVTLRADGRLIGGCGIHRSTGPDRAGWIGYGLARPFWGQGYATEAARALVGFGFGTLGLHRIFATCDVRNVASARVLEKVGMRREGHLREDKWVRGQWRDSYVYGILEYEWSQADSPGNEDSS